jgi:hypothetical protein
LRRDSGIGPAAGPEADLFRFVTWRGCARRKAVIAPEWIDEVGWLPSEVVVNLTHEQVRGVARYDLAATTGRAYEAELTQHYGIPGHRTRG